MNKITKKIYKIDATDKILGKLSVEVANILRGKDRADFQANNKSANQVIIINSDKIKFTGNKIYQKNYFRHSQYLGNLRRKNLSEAMDSDSRWVVKHSIEGMLPKNRLQKTWLKNLKIHKKDDK